MGSPATVARPGSRVRAMLAAVHSVWWLNLGIAGLAALLYVGAVRDYEAIAAPHIAWYWLVLATAVCERWPVHLQFGRSAHSFSLTDIPFTFALLFLSGPEAVGALATGTAIALHLRRQAPIKFVFNLAQFVLALEVGMLVLHGAAGAEPTFGPRVWIGSLAATQVGGLLTILLLATAMSLADGRIAYSGLREMLGMDTLVTAVNSSLALIAAVLLVAEPAALPILLIPLVVATLGYRAYLKEHERHKKVQFLYQANRGLLESAEVALALEGMLSRAREAFRAENAEVILFASDGGPPRRTRLGPDGEHERLEPIDLAAAAALRALAEDGPVALEGPLDDALLPLIGSREIRDAMAAVLRVEGRVIGTLMLANRVGLANGFGREDLALFETLAANASAALQFDRLEHAVNDLKALQEQLHHLAYHDPLTGLANRTLFSQSVAAALEAGVGVAVTFIDLDDFKGINDTLGHTVGDELLKAAAGRLRRCVRLGDLVARLGGDEFAILMRAGDGDVHGIAVATADRVVQSFEQPVAVGAQLLSVHLSVGVATTGDGTATVAELLRDADLAMYEAKSAGKRRFAVFTPEMRSNALRRHALHRELQDVIKDEGLDVVYQPIVDLRSSSVTGVEALVRWNHIQRGPIAPSEFIAMAEETDLIVPLGRFVLRAACQQAAKWADAGHGPVTMHVNLSARELDDPDLIASVQEALDLAGLAPERLVLEITESVLVDDISAGREKLQALRDLGVRLALDDFGTGFSSLSYLRLLPLDSLKIAMEFIETLNRSEDDKAFVRMMVELGRMRELQVVAEGIERVEQLETLQSLGCDLGQGYYFARPLDADDPALLDAIGAGAAVA